MGETMTARQFLESSWFKLLWRGVIVVGLPALSGVSAYAGYTLNTVYAQQSTLNGEIANIQSTQEDRAQVNDDFQADISAEVQEVKEGVGGLRSDMMAVKLQVSEMVGVLKEMQRQSIAARFVPD